LRQCWQFRCFAVAGVEISKRIGSVGSFFEE
jgi:hypothetical protein